jgi:MYXO-CTERM domain-containing protein
MVMIVRLLLLVVGLIHVFTGVAMLVAPGVWYVMVPGVVMTGPFNAHFIYDIGMAFIASGAMLALGARVNRNAAVYACAGAVWPVLHALIHIKGWMSHGFPTESNVAASEIVGVVALAALGAALAWARRERQ